MFEINILINLKKKSINKKKSEYLLKTVNCTTMLSDKKVFEKRSKLIIFFRRIVKKKSGWKQIKIIQKLRQKARNKSKAIKSIYY